MREYSILTALALIFPFVWTSASAPKITRRSSIDQHVQIRGYIKNAKDGDTVSLHLWNTFVIEDREMTLPHKEQNVRIHNGHFDFNAESLQQIGYITIQCPSSGIYLDHYLAEPGDNVFINIAGRDSISDEPIISVKGPGCEKYQCKNELKHHFFESYIYGRHGVYSYAKAGADSSNYIALMERVFRKQDSITAKWTSVLDGYKGKLSAAVFSVMKMDIVGEHEYNRLMYFVSPVVQVIEQHNLVLTKDSLNAVYIHLNELFNKVLHADLMSVYTSDQIVNSRVYLKYLLLKNRTQNRLQRNGDDVYFFIKMNTNGIIRDRLITSWLVANFEYIKGGDEIIKDALNIVSDGYCYSLLTSLAKAQMKGSVAYDFALPDTSGRIIHLSDFKGKVVMIDFWYDHCGACIEYYTKDLSKAEEEYKDNKEVVFITINVDKNKKQWMSAIYDGRHTSPLCINLSTDGVGINCPVIKYYNVQAYPRPLLIDREGKLFENSEAFLRSYKSLIPTIKSALERREARFVSNK